MNTSINDFFRFNILFLLAPTVDSLLVSVHLLHDRTFGSENLDVSDRRLFSAVATFFFFIILASQPFDQHAD